MADDQTPKTMDINDLVRELSKSSTNPVAPTPPLAPSTQAPRPIPPTPPSTSSGPSAKPPMSPPMAGLPTTPSSPAPKPFVPPTTTRPPVVPPPTSKPEAPRPQFNVPPQSFAQPLVGQAKPAPAVGGAPLKAVAPAPIVPPPATSGVKEYQSSIRTMNEDISNIKQGQKPAGINIPRKVEQVPPATAPSGAPPKAVAMPSQQFKVPSVNLGESQKTGPLAQSKDASKPSITSQQKPQIYVPEGGSKGGNRNMLFLGIGAMALVAGFAYWFFVLRAGVPEVVIESPTPTPTATPTPTPTLSSIFGGLESQTVCGANCAVADFNSGLGSGMINGGQFKNVYVFESNSSLSITQLLDVFKLPYPIALKDLIWQDYLTLAYGQKEIYDANGLIKTDALVEKRLVSIGEVKDAVVLEQTIKAWEAEMASNLKTLFQLDLKKQASAVFMDNSYRGVSIRYNNYKYSDRSIDYAIVTAFNGRTYFVIGNSREAMYATIDKLKGF